MVTESKLTGFYGNLQQERKLGLISLWFPLTTLLTPAEAARERMSEGG